MQSTDQPNSESIQPPLLVLAQQLGGLQAKQDVFDRHIHDTHAHDTRFSDVFTRLESMREDLTRVLREEIGTFTSQDQAGQEGLKKQLVEIRAIAVTSQDDAEQRKAREAHMEQQDEQTAVMTTQITELRGLLQAQTEIEAQRQDALKEAERMEAMREEKRRQHIATVAKQTEQQTRDLSAQIAAQNKQLGDTLARYFGPLGVAAFSYFLVGSSTAGQTRTLVLAGIVVVVIFYIIAMIVRRAVIARRLRALQRAAHSERPDDASTGTSRQEMP